LEKLYEKITLGNFDLVYSLYHSVQHNHKIIPIRLRPKNEHDNSYFSPASSWLFDIKIYSDIGPWKSFKELYNMPSQAWLLKVAKTKRIGLVNEVTIISIPSGNRINSYKNKDFIENEFYYNSLKHNPDKLLKKIYYDQFRFLKERDSKISYHLIAVIRNIILRILNFTGITLGQIIIFSKNPKKGSFINHLRKVRGLPKI
jgi:hypothetical protein